MKKLLIIKAGSKLPELAETHGDFEDWVLAGMNWPRDKTVVVSVHENASLPKHDGVSAVIIPGSSAMVTDSDAWIHTTKEWLRAAVNDGIPVLGICFGHQLLASALGASVTDNPNGIEVGTVSLCREEATENDLLLADFKGNTKVQMSHRQSVVTPPPEAVVLAHTDKDNCAAFRFGKNAWGVQFHPEFNQSIVEKYIGYYKDDLLASGENVKHIENTTEETPLAVRVLQRFVLLLD